MSKREREREKESKRKREKESKRKRERKREREITKKERERNNKEREREKLFSALRQSSSNIIDKIISETRLSRVVRSQTVIPSTSHSSFASWPRFNSSQLIYSAKVHAAREDDGGSSADFADCVTVRSDVAIKRSPNFPKSCPK